MTQQAGSGRKGSFRYHIPAAACSTLLVLLLLSVTSCSRFRRQEAPPPATTIDLPTDALSDRTVVAVERLDTDGDGGLEWLVYYRFDEVNQNGPINGVIYDVVPRSSIEFPVILPYKLRLPNNNYLALRRPAASAVTLASDDGQSRGYLVFSTPTDMSFFRINPANQDRLFDEPSLYQCVGFFRSEDGVHLDAANNRVVVTSLNGYERSRLVIRRYYKPGPEGFFMPGTNVLAPPTGAEVDFPAGIPADILDTPYPEKIVLAFYQTLGPDNALPNPSAYLAPNAQQAFAGGSLWYGSPYAADQIRNAVVKELRYYPTEEESTSTLVEVSVVFISQTADRSEPIAVRWRMSKINDKWKMDYTE